MRAETVSPRWILGAILVLPLGVVVGGCDDAPRASEADGDRIESETARLNEWFETRFEEQLDFSPMEKTRLGRKDDYDRIDDFSEEASDGRLAWLRQTVIDLQQNFNYDLLTPEAKTSYDLWSYRLERGEAARPYRRRGYLFHQMRGLHTSLPQFLITQHRVDDEADMVAYITRLREGARALSQILDRAKLAAEEGVHAPSFAYEAVIAQSRAVITGVPFSTEAGAAASPLWGDATAKIDALVEDGEIDATRADELRADASAALTDSLEPAYEAIVEWAESELPHADAVATGVWKLPNGPAYYQERLAAMTTTEMTADEIHELGLREVARIHAEMEGIRDEVGFEGTLQDLFAFIRQAPEFYLPDTDEGRQSYLDRARSYLDAIEARLPDYFGLIPKARLEVRRVEAFREQPGQAQHYQRGTPDGSRPGIYYSHLSDMTAMPLWDMEAVAYHEGLPGHHMQISIAQELEGLPMFRTQYGATAYVEGWGLYAELLAKEMGAYEDPYSDFGRLNAELWRAMRLVVDTGLHAKRWTEADAVAYMTENSALSAGQIRAEVRRYMVMPGQATSYKIGMLEILELRERACAALGADFDIAAFHDVVLGGGALPLSILERRVDAWIAASTAPPS
jgi:uncharacterized protein (DUF885 family)